MRKSGDITYLYDNEKKHWIGELLVKLAIFFPFVGIINGIDNQPNLIILLVFAIPLLAYKFSLRTEPEFLLLISLVLVCFLLRFVLENEYVTPKYILTYLSSIYIFASLYLLVYNRLLDVSLRFLIFCGLIYAFVGFAQLFYPDFLAGVVNRSLEQALSYTSTGRGVRSLTGEPAALGKVFTTLNVLMVFLILINKEIHKKLLFCICTFAGFLVVSAVLSRSAYALAIHLVLFFVFLFVLSKAFFIIFFTSFSVLLLLFLNVDITEFSDIRALNVFYQLFTDPSLLLQQGAIRRVLNIPISLNSLNYYGILGAGNSTEVFLADINTPFGRLTYNAHNRNLGGLIEYVLKFGLLSVPLFFILGFMIIKIALLKVFVSGRKLRVGIFLAVSIILLSFQDSSVSLSFSWFVLIFFYVFSTRINKQNKVIVSSFNKASNY
ncbi:hypothetical protein ISX50_08155 [Vibrio cyclitrophicus]|nr:hypothetical protein [Vibrio cyclitrophicus]UPR33122.1 hypothetical protein ISX50_08155 [Vibrio cyclitrophicus]